MTKTTFVAFIQTKITEDSPVGNLARAILLDKGFPINGTEEERTDFLRIKTTNEGTLIDYKNLMEEYVTANEWWAGKAKPIETDFDVLREKAWDLLMRNFKADSIALVGMATDIRRVYCINTHSGQAFKFELKWKNDLTDLIDIIDLSQVPKNDLTEVVGVREAISRLENCSYKNTKAPNESSLLELFEFLIVNR